MFAPHLRLTQFYYRNLGKHSFLTVNEMMVLDLSRMVSNHRRHSHVEAREIAEKMTHSLNKMGVKMYKSGTRWNLREDDFRTAYANATY